MSTQGPWELSSLSEGGLKQTGHLKVPRGIMTESEVMSSLHEDDY